ncbi:MAG: hypothetical protein ACT4P6_13325 [Gemmatimonadaceae bacterium]
MPEAASASVSLSAKIPDPAAFLSLVESLSGSVAGVEMPQLPFDKIEKLVKGFRFELPDPSRWKVSVTADASRIAFTLPDPSALLAPLEKPLTAVKDVASIDFAGGIDELQLKLQTLGGQAQADPKAFVKAMFTPTSPVADLIRQSPFMRLIISLGKLFGVADIEKAPETALALGAWIQQLLHERVGSVLVAFVAAGRAATLTRRLERAAELLDASLRTDAFVTLRQAAIDGYATANAALRAVASGNVESELAAKTALLAARAALQAYIDALSRALAFGEASAATVDVATASLRFEAIGKSLADVKRESLTEVAAAFEALVGKGAVIKTPAKTAASELDATVKRILLELKGRVDDFDISSIQKGIDSLITTLTMPIDKLESFKADVESAVRGALETIRDAVAAVDLTPLRAEFDRVMSEVEGTVKQVSGEITEVRQAVDEGIARASAALSDARDFVLGEQGLKAQIDAVFKQLRDLLQQLNVQGTLDTVTGAVADVSVQLERIEIAPVVDATVTAIDAVAAILDKVAPLIVTDDLRDKLAEATDVLRQVDFGEIRSELQKILDEIIDGVNNDALGRISAEYNKAVAAIGKLDPTPVLEGLQTEVFDPLIAELEKIKPAEAMAPMVSAFAEARGTLDSFDPTASLAFLVEFHRDIKTRFDQISPDRLLEPIERALADVRTSIAKVLRIHQIHAVLEQIEGFLAPVLDAVDLAKWFGQLDGGLGEMRRVIETFDMRELLGPLGGILRDVFERTGAVLDQAGLAALFEALATSGEPLNTRLTRTTATIAGVRDRSASINVAAVITELRPLHQSLNATFSGAAIGANAKVELSGIVTALDPMTAFATLQSRAPRAQAAIVTLHGDFSAMASSAAPVLASAQEVINALRILRRPLEALWELVLNPLRSFVTIPQRAGIRAILLAIFDALDPRRWKSEIEQVAQSLVAKVKVLIGATVIAALKGAVEKVSALIDGLNIDVLANALRGVHGSIAAQIDALDPNPLIATFRATYDTVLAAVDALDPGPLVIELDTVYTRDVVGLVKAISPRDLLLEPLKKIFAEISAMLGVLDIGELFKPVLDQLQRLRDELLEGVARAGVSYNGLLAAIPTGSASASVSVSVDVG